MSTNKLISIGQIIDQSWEHYTKHFKELMNISLWYFLVALLLTIGSLLSPVDNGLLAAGGSFSVLEALGLSITVITSLIVTPITGIWVYMSLMRAVKNQMAGKSVNLKEINRQTWSQMLHFIAMAILRSLAIVAPVLLLVPGIALIVTNVMTTGGAWLGALSLILTFLGTVGALIGSILLAIYLNFASYELVLGGQGIIESLKGSVALVRGKFWPVFWRVVIPKLVYSIPVVVLQIGAVVGINLLLASLSTVSDNVVFQIADLFGNITIMGLTALVTPMILLSDYLIYESLGKKA